MFRKWAHGLVVGLLLGSLFVAFPAAQNYIWYTINGVPYNSALSLGDTLTFTSPAGTVRTGTTAADTLSLAAYDVDGAAYTNLLTLTAGNTPTIGASAASADGALIINPTWTDSGVTYNGLKIIVTDTASSGTSRILSVFGGAGGTTDLLAINKTGQLSLIPAGAQLSWATATLTSVTGGLRLSTGSISYGALLGFGSSNANAGISFQSGLSTGASSIPQFMIKSGSGSDTFNDATTAASATVATRWLFASNVQPTLTATNASVTYSDAATIYLANAPTAGTNVTITRPWAFWVDAGAVRFDGDIYVDATTAGADCSSAAAVTTVNGIVTVCSAPTPDPLTQDEINAVRGLIAQMRGKQ